MAGTKGTFSRHMRIPLLRIRSEVHPAIILPAVEAIIGTSGYNTSSWSIITAHWRVFVLVVVVIVTAVIAHNNRKSNGEEDEKQDENNAAPPPSF